MADTKFNISENEKNAINWKELVEELEELCKENPEDYGNHTQLGYVLREMGEIDRAKKEYEKAIQLNNEYADAHNNLGYLYLHDLNNIELAEKHLLKAIENDKEFANPYRHLGDLYYTYKNNLQNAKLYYQQALDIKSDFKEAQQNLDQINNILNKEEIMRDLTPCSKDIMLTKITEKKNDEDEIKEPETIEEEENDQDDNFHEIKHDDDDGGDDDDDNFNIMDDYDDDDDNNEEEEEEEEEENEEIPPPPPALSMSNKLTSTPIDFEDRPSYKNVDSMNIYEKQQENDAMMAAIKHQNQTNNNNTNIDSKDLLFNNFQIPNFNNFESNTSVKSVSLYNLNSNTTYNSNLSPFLNDSHNNNNDHNLELEDCGSERLKLLFRNANNNSLFAWLEQQEQAKNNNDNNGIKNTEDKGTPTVFQN